MKNKRCVALALSAGMLITGFQGCKKGDGDPFLSLRSRKARVAGEWTIEKMLDESSYTSSSVSSNPSTNSGTSRTEINGGNVTMSGSSNYQSGGFSSSDSQTGSGSVKTSVVFDKDGTFKLKVEFVNMTVTETSDGDSFVYTSNQVTELSGTWNFLGGVEDDYKNKERMILNIQKESETETLSADGAMQTSNYTSTYSNGAYSQIWQITQLKNKEMKVEATSSGTGNSTTTFTFDGNSETTSSNSTHTGKSSMTLVQ